MPLEWTGADELMLVSDYVQAWKELQKIFRDSVFLVVHAPTYNETSGCLNFLCNEYFKATRESMPNSVISVFNAGFFSDQGDNVLDRPLLCVEDVIRGVWTAVRPESVPPAEEF